MERCVTQMPRPLAPSMGAALCLVGYYAQGVKLIPETLSISSGSSCRGGRVCVCVGTLAGLVRIKDTLVLAM